MTKDDGKELIEFDCEVEGGSSKAHKVELLLAKNKKRTIWVPMSISKLTEKKTGTTIGIQRWFCEKENLL